MNKKESILILGESGFIGKRLFQFLSKKNWQIFGFSRKSGLDLMNYEIICEKFSEISPDIIVNCASHHGTVHYGIKNPAVIVHENMLMALNIYKGLYEICPNATIINLLSNCTYPGSSQIQTEKEWWNGIPHSSTLSFASSRRMIYVLALAYNQQYKIKSKNIILPGIYGPGDHTDTNRVHAVDGMIIRMIQTINKGEKVFRIWGTGSPIREWCYIDDLLKVISILIVMKDSILYPMNIGQKKGYSVCQIAQIISEILDYNGQLIFDTNYPDGDAIKILDNEKFREILPEIIFTDIKDGIKNTIEYYQKIL